MPFAVNRADYRFADEVGLLMVLERLSGFGELSAEGSLGVRFEPLSLTWPPTYFRSDGTIHIVTGGMSLDAIAAYLRDLEELMGTPIIEEAPEH